MKFLDDVRVVNDNYLEQGVSKGMVGTIIDADIRWNSFFLYVFKTKEFMIRIL